jgi:hypothetical protein
MGWNLTNFSLGWPNLSSFDGASIAKRRLFSQLFLFIYLRGRNIIFGDSLYKAAAEHYILFITGDKSSI